MGWTYCVIWFLCLSVSECWQLPYTEPEIRGEVQSPQYPQPYLPNLLKQWHLWVPKGYKIRLSLTHLDIKASAGCYEDSLMVLEDQKILGKFCGQENSTDHPGKELILSQSNRLTLIFQTNDSTAEPQQHTGFFATYKAIDIDECLKVDSADGSGPLCSQICVNSPGSYHCSCHNGYKIHLDQRTCLFSCSGHIFTKHEGHLSSPKYPGPSPPFLSCKYIISVEPRFTVTLNFTDKFHIMSVDTEQGPRCLHHWLQVTIPDREPMKLCGGKGPGLIATNASTVRLDYHTDDEGLSHGWGLEYYTTKAYMGHTDVKALYKSPVYAASVHVHPGYNNPDGFDYNNDIALIKVNESITFNSSIMPICLPPEAATYVTGMMGIVSGFGIMNIYPPRMTKKLMYADLPVVEQETCLNSVNKVKMTRDNVPDLTNNMLCAGVPEGGKDSCLGDHGGPFALKHAGQFWAAGIVSWGVDCGQQGMYGVYTRVSNYVDWIKKTMREN